MLDPNKQGAPYFIMSVTALPQFALKKQQNDESNYFTIVKEIVANHLPKNQPVLKMFLGPEVKSREVINSQGYVVGFADTTFLWSAEELDNNTIMRQAIKNHETRTTPYTVAHIENGPYIAGSLTQLKRLFEGRQDYTIETVVLKSRGTATHYHRHKNPSLPSKSPIMWLRDANKIAQGIFSWPLSKQDSLFIQSTHRVVEFERNGDSNSQIKTSSMVTWENLPSNEELLKQRDQWDVNVFLMQVRQGYLLIPIHELDYLLANADEKPQVHSLVLSSSAKRQVQNAVQGTFQNMNLDCESIRVLSAGGLELAYSPQCSLLATESGWGLARASEEAQLASAQDNNQPIAIFRFEDKPSAALPIRTLVDATPASLEDLKSKYSSTSL